MSPDKQVTLDQANGAPKVEEAAKIGSEQLENALGEGLNAEHREYLLKRHGTVDLLPLPSMSPDDPLNWPIWKKNTNLMLVVFHAMMTTFTAASIVPAFALISESLSISLNQASYLTSIQILVLGLAPFFWKPISNHYGRRPIALISTIGSCICNIGCAYSHSYAAMVICRILVAFFISPAGAISAAVIVEIFFAKERGQKMGLWMLMITLGPPLGPFLMGFVAYHTGGYIWIYYICAITNAAQFILYFFFSPETLFDRDTQITPASKSHSLAVNFRPLTSAGLSFREFFSPLRLFAYPTIIIPAIVYALVFNFVSVLLTVEIPQLFIPKFGFNPQQLGLQFLGMIIGSVLGEQLSGYGSDLWMRLGRKSGKPPEYRLWLSYIGIILTVVGLIVFCVQMDQAVQWNVTPIVGIAIASFGCQVIGTVVHTYTVDCYQSEAASVGVLISLVRSTWAFIGPFYLPEMFENLGFRASAGLMSAILLLFGLVGLGVTHIWGGKWRQRLGNIQRSNRDPLD